MNYFWGNIFEYVKDRRFAPVFFGTLAVLFGMPLGIAILGGSTNIGDYLRYWPFLIAVLAICLLIVIWREVAEARRRRRNRYKISPMSRDELRKARSKLVRSKT